MNAWRLPDGRVLIPKRAQAGTVIGDGLVVADAESAEAIEWRPWTQPAPPMLIAEWARIEADRDRAKGDHDAKTNE